MILGRYREPATDVGLALTAKILKSNGQVVYRSTLRHLTDHEHACPVHTANRKSFDDSIAEQLGPAAQDSTFPADNLTPEYELFGDVGDADFDPDPDHADLKVTPEVNDNYIGVDLLFPKGRTMTRGCVTAKSGMLMVTPRGVPIPVPSSTHVNTR